MCLHHVTLSDLEALSLGAAILGSGGGGSPSYHCLMTSYFIEEKGPVSVMSIDDLEEEDLVVPIAFMGAPVVGLEKIASGREFKVIIDQIEKKNGKKVTALVSAEIGGGNAFSALWVSRMLDIPVLDGDLMGRAFPELQMNSAHLLGIPATPAYLADALGNSVIIESDDIFSIERIARNVTVAMGSRAALAIHTMSGAMAKYGIIKGSLMRAIHIGQAIIEARKKHENPCEALLNATSGVRLANGFIVDVTQTVERGFLSGSITMISKERGERVTVKTQNEYLIAESEHHILATTPDILMFVEEDTAEPVLSDSVRYGLRVDLIAIEANPLWTTEKGLSLVGPRYFGYNKDYRRGSHEDRH